MTVFFAVIAHYHAVFGSHEVEERLRSGGVRAVVPRFEEVDVVRSAAHFFDEPGFRFDGAVAGEKKLSARRFHDDHRAHAVALLGVVFVVAVPESAVAGRVYVHRVARSGYRVILAVRVYYHALVTRFLDDPFDEAGIGLIFLAGVVYHVIHDVGVHHRFEHIIVVCVGVGDDEIFYFVHFDVFEIRKSFRSAVGKTRTRGTRVYHDRFSVLKLQHYRVALSHVDEVRFEYYIVERYVCAYRYVAAYRGVCRQYPGISAVTAVHVAAFVELTHEFFYKRLSGRTVCEGYEQPEYENYGYGYDRYRFPGSFFTCHLFTSFGRAAPGYFFIVLAGRENFKRGFFSARTKSGRRRDFSAANP